MMTETQAVNQNALTPVRTLMKRWPKTIRLFLDRGMACVGCPVGGLHTLEEACAAHKVDLDPLLSDISKATTTIRARFPQPE